VNHYASCYEVWFKVNNIIIKREYPFSEFPYVWTLFTVSWLQQICKYINETVYTKFLGLQLQSHLNWKDHVDQMIIKLSAACYTLWSMFHVSNIITPKSIYFAHFHSEMQYGIILGGNSSNSWRILSLQKIFRQIHQSTVLKQGIRTIFIDQLSTYLVFRRVHSNLVTEYSTVYHVGS